MAKPISWDGSDPRVMEAIIGRQKLKRLSSTKSNGRDSFQNGIRLFLVRT